MLAWLVLAVTAPPLEATFVPAEPAIGDPVVVFVRAKVAGEIEVFGKSFALLPAEDGWLRGFIGVPIDVEAGTYGAKISVGRREGRSQLTVKHEEFRTSKLRVSEKFTSEKKPRALELRIEAEQKAWEALFVPEPEPLTFSGAVVRPVRGSTTSEFGVRRTFNGKTESRHLGLDLEGRIGDPIRAAQAGTIVMSSMRFQTGGTVVIEHGSGLFSAYFHLSRRSVKEGQKVAAGAVIGRVGATGRVTGPHLHLAVLIRATERGKSKEIYVDPERFFELNVAPPKI